MKTLLTLILSLISYIVFPQGEANNWYFGAHAGLTFNTNPPSALIDGALNTSEGCASISDASGNLLFYTDGTNVYNRNHALMTNGNGLMGNPSSAQSAIIFQKPGSFTNYYIITVPETGTVGMRYSEVDMSLSGGLGAVLASNKNTLLFQPSSEKVTAVKHANGIYYWIIGRYNSTSKKYVAFLVDCDGINPTPIESTVGITNGENWGYLVASPDGTRLASASSGSGVEITDFNSATGEVSNTQFLGSLSYEGVNGGNYGVAFSPDGTKLYASSITNWGLVQWDLTQANIAASSTLIGYTNGSAATRPSYHGGAIQLGPDGKIYITETGLPSLGVINNPNAAGVACNYTPSAVNLQGRTTRLGLPPFVSSFFITTSNIQYQGTCVDKPTDFTILGGSNLDSVKWNFGDYNSTSNTSTSFSPSHTYTAPGTYTITLIRHIACIADTIQTTIFINDYQRKTREVLLCPNASFTLPSNQVVSNPGTYIDTIYSGQPLICDQIITTILLDESLSFVVSTDTSICIGEAVQLFASGGQSYQWDPEPTLSDTTIPNPIVTPTTTTTYTIRTKVRTGVNLVRNGDFSIDSVHFISMYNLQHNLVTQGGYTVAPSVTNEWFAGCVDHTTGDGNMLIADAACGTNNIPAYADLWCQSIEVEPNTDYSFATFVTNLNIGQSIANIGFFINGQQIGAVQSSSEQSCMWNEYNAIWNSGTSTHAFICLREMTGDCSGADFAVDDISFYKVCEIIDSVTVFVSNPIAVADTIHSISCFGESDGSVQTSISGQIGSTNVVWNTNPIQNGLTATNLTAGTYSAIFTDELGCTTNIEVTITQPAPLTSNIASSTNATCFQSTNGQATIQASGGTTPYTYQWNSTPTQSQETLTGVGAGTYSVLVTDANGCTTTNQINITEPTAIVSTIDNLTNVSCFDGNDGSASITSSGGTAPLSISWTSNPVQTSFNLTNVSEGTYLGIITDANGCTDTVTAVINQPTELEATLTASQNLICPDETITLTTTTTGGTPNYTFSWNHDGNQTESTFLIIPNSNTTYQVMVSDANGCTTTAQTAVEIVVLPTPNMTASPTEGCTPLIVNFNNLSQGSYTNAKWDLGNGTILNTLNPVSTTYTDADCFDITLELQTQEGCVTSITMQDMICTLPQPEAQFTVNKTQLTTIDTEVKTQNLSQNASIYYWTFGDGLSSSNAFEPTHIYNDEVASNYTITLIASNEYDCYDTATIIIRIEEEVLIYVPNTFTPDGNAFNQTFKPVIGSGVDIYDYKLSIYNRWGEYIFESNDVEYGWEGISFFTGEPCQDGTYIWKIEFKVNGRDEHRILHGNVNLLR